MVELKSVDGINAVHEAQVMTYLKLTGKNFGTSCSISMFVDCVMASNVLIVD